MTWRPKTPERLGPVMFLESWREQKRFREGYHHQRSSSPLHGMIDRSKRSYFSLTGNLRSAKQEPSLYSTHTQRKSTLMHSLRGSHRLVLQLWDPIPAIGLRNANPVYKDDAESRSESQGRSTSTRSIRDFLQTVPCLE